MNKNRMVSNFIEMIKIHSPSCNEKEYGFYLIKELEKLGGEIYLDNNFEKYMGNCPNIFAKFKGNISGNGITLVAHMDVIEPSYGVKPIIEGNIIRTDGTTTLGGDDKAGIASILEVLKTVKEEKLNTQDIYILFTPGEEIGMAGSKSIEWSKVPEHIKPAMNMIVVDNAGAAGFIAHAAPSKYNFKIEFKGKKAHAGIEPEKGINSIILASKALAQMETGRIDELTTSNISEISSNYPTNVVPEECCIIGEIRGHSEERIFEILEKYKEICEEIKKEMSGDYKFTYECDFPILKSKDNLKFAKEFAEIYESIGVKANLQVIGGGSDSNIFAKEGYNSIIIGVGMYNVHTVEETLDISELVKTTEAILKFIVKK